MRIKGSNEAKTKIMIVALLSVFALLIAPMAIRANANDVASNNLMAAPSLEKTAITLDKNYSSWATVNIRGIDPYDDVDVFSSNSSIATAYHSYGESNISVSAYKKGNAVITVKVTRYFDSYTDDPNDYVQVTTLKLNVTVTDMKITSTKSVYNSLTMYKGESAQLEITGNSNLNVSFTSKNKKIATVTSSGKVKAKGFGNGVIDIKVGENVISYPVSVGSKKGVKAARWAMKYAGKAKYSNAKRMSKGYFDCSSLTGRAYRSQGLLLGGTSAWSTTAAGQAYWCLKNNHVLFMNANDIDAGQMRPGDLLFYKTGYAGVNREYRHIDHVAIYLGNGYKAEVEEGIVGAVGWGGTTGAIMIGRPTQYATPVPMVSGLQAKKASSTSVKLNWKKKTGVTGYQILRATDDRYGEYKVVANIRGASKKSYLNKSLTPGHTYYYQIRAFKKSKGQTFLGRLQSSKYGATVTKSVKL